MNATFLKAVGAVIVTGAALVAGGSAMTSTSSPSPPHAVEHSSAHPKRPPAPTPSDLAGSDADSCARHCTTRTGASDLRPSTVAAPPAPEPAPPPAPEADRTAAPSADDGAAASAPAPRPVAPVPPPPPEPPPKPAPHPAPTPKPVDPPTAPPASPPEHPAPAPEPPAPQPQPEPQPHPQPNPWLPQLPPIDLQVDIHVLVVSVGTGDVTAPPVPSAVHVRVDVAVQPEAAAPPPELRAPEHCGSRNGTGAPAPAATPGPDRPTTYGQGATPDGAAASGGSEEGAVAMT